MGGATFTWKWVSPQGRSGGLVGIRDSMFDPVEFDMGRHFIRMLVFDKNNDVR